MTATRSNGRFTKTKRNFRRKRIQFLETWFKQ